MTKRRVTTHYECPTCGRRQTVYIRPTWVTCHDRRHKPTEMVVVVEEPLDAARPKH